MSKRSLTFFGVPLSMPLQNSRRLGLLLLVFLTLQPGLPAMGASLQDELKPIYPAVIQRELPAVLKTLTPEHIIFLTKDFSSDPFPTLLGLSLKGEALCTERDYKKLKEKLELPFLYEQSLDLMLMVRDEGRKENFARLERLIELLSQWNRPKDQELLRELKKIRLNQSNEPLRDRIDRARLRLSRYWNIPGQKLNEKWLELRALSPSCLGTFNETYFEHIKKDVTLYRAQALQKALKAYYQKKGDFPQKLEDLVLQGDPALLRTKLDGWFRPFQLKGKGQKSYLYSQGASAENSEDDFTLKIFESQ